ncbi:hypothetical protein T492DRAFT_886799 [Pavlovales sp. CCMP2436]|nr:hypothetical protein T492DRAFT_886799 [Pavlovales sp. CCMP2436]
MAQLLMPAPVLPAPLLAVPVLEEPKRAMDAVELDDPRMRQALAFIDSQDVGVLDKARKLLQDSEKKKMYFGVGNVKRHGLKTADNLGKGKNLRVVVAKYLVTYAAFCVDMGCNLEQQIHNSGGAGELPNLKKPRGEETASWIGGTALLQFTGILRQLSFIVPHGDASKALILRSVLLDCVKENGADDDVEIDSAAAVRMIERDDLLPTELAAEKPTLPDVLARVACAMFSPEMTIQMDRAFIGNTRAEVDQGMQKNDLWVE